MLLVWSASTTPEMRPPAGLGTSNGQSRRVPAIGAMKAQPVNALSARSYRTSPGLLLGETSELIPKISIKKM